MLTHEKLVDLYRELQEEQVLSVYLDAEEHDPAERSVWRRRFEQCVADVRKGLEDASAEEREGFEEALSRIQEELDEFDAFLPAKGWVGFATADEVWYTESVPVPMPDLVRWEKGLRVAPYVRGLKQDRVVVTVLVDSRRARIFEYRDGDVVEPEGLRADTFLGDLSDIGMQKRGRNHSGVRGKTGTDAAQKFLEVGSERMLKKLMEVVSERVGSDGFLVVGGTPEAVSAAAQQAPRSIESRLLQQPSLHLEMRPAEVKEAAEEAASTLTRRMQERLLAEVVDLARSGGRGCLGREETERALRESRVGTLLLSRNFIRDNPDYADRCVGTAFEQHADVEELSRHEAEHLDREGEGIGARLRFLIRQNGGQTEAAPQETSAA